MSKAFCVTLKTASLSVQVSNISNWNYPINHCTVVHYTTGHLQHRSPPWPRPGWRCCYPWWPWSRSPPARPGRPRPCASAGPGCTPPPSHCPDTTEVTEVQTNWKTETLLKLSSKNSYFRTNKRICIANFWTAPWHCDTGHIPMCWPDIWGSPQTPGGPRTHPPPRHWPPAVCRRELRSLLEEFGWQK